MSPRSTRFRAALLTVLVFVVSAPIFAALLFVPVMLLAGPHSSMLPGFLQPVVLFAGWAAVVLVPAGLSRLVYRRLSRAAGAETPPRTPASNRHSCTEFTEPTKR